MASEESQRTPDTKKAEADASKNRDDLTAASETPATRKVPAGRTKSTKEQTKTSTEITKESKALPRGPHCHDWCSKWNQKTSDQKK